MGRGWAIASSIKIYQALSDGPKTTADLCRLLHYNPSYKHPQLNGLMTSLTALKFVTYQAPYWQLTGDHKVCPTCQGKGLIENADES